MNESVARGKVAKTGDAANGMVAFERIQIVMTRDS